MTAPDSPPPAPDSPETPAPLAPHSPRGTLPAFAPVPRLKQRSNGWTPAVQCAFIEALADTGSVSSACRAVGRADHGAYLLRRHPEAGEFRAAWAAALDLGIQRIEDVAMERALHGVEVPVYSYGKLVGSRTVHNDRLLMFLLRNRAPQRFSEGRARGLSALDRMELARLKKQWHREWRETWEAERALRDTEEEQESYERIDAWIDTMHTNRMRRMSPRARAALDEHNRIMEEDRAAGYDPWHDPEHPDYHGAAARAAAGESEAIRLPPPGWGEKEEEPEQEPGPRRHGLKDEGWE
ncbi:hypothetical protein Q9K01_08105 [Qipengyuania sp. DY56-A-20]|jgi:hypothetical protein|uniref:Uncharacterized protein n=1 Tax=Qipengyuania benthica TaxID=3067651 RepID=A0ABT9H8D6_9SPHN|nr:hypothetical protein [Qipengyuania sp. DY56-A-20]MDP4539581.1 hypothetical protein [Qipengyuania sp. DY56-A-20]